MFPPHLPIFFYTLSIPKIHVISRPDRMETSSTTFSAEAYFETQPPPPTIEQDVQSVRAFLKQQRGHRRKVVLVTVGRIVVSPPRAEHAYSSPVRRRAEGQLFPWNSMCERINSLSPATITSIYTRMASPPLGLRRAQCPVLR